MLEQSDFDRIKTDVRSELADSQMVTMYALREQDVSRQTYEDERAIKRNRNRFATLMGALLIGIVVTYGLTNNGFPMLGITFPHWVGHYSAYSFVITIILDSGLALYAYVKRY